MQEVRYPNGRFERTFIEAETQEELKRRLREEYDKAMAAGAEEIRQAVVDPEQRCPCHSGKKTKNCCLKRLARKAARLKEKVKP